MGQFKKTYISPIMITGIFTKLRQQLQLSKLLTIVTIAVVVMVWRSEASALGVLYKCEDDNGRERISYNPKSGKCVLLRQKKQVTYSFQKRKFPRSMEKRKGALNFSLTYDSQINRFGSKYNVDVDLIKAVIRTESCFNRYAVSPRGAQGLMQLMPDTARELKVFDPFNPSQNIDGGTRYLRSLLDAFGGDLKLTLAAYNAGPTLVKKIQQVPQIAETVNYINRVLTYYQRYKN